MYEIIPNRLATHGIGDNNLVEPFFNSSTGIALHNKEGDEVTTENGDYWYILDARVISDEGISDILDYAYLIAYADHMLKGNEACVVCCGVGQSRSNAIALGILVHHFKMDFYEAYELIREKVPIQWIHPDHIAKLKKLFNVTLP